MDGDRIHATDGATEIGRFALSEGVRAIQEQTAEARAIKERIVTLIGLTAAASAFLVGAALQASTRGVRFYGPLLVGTLLFVALLLIGWRILRPLPDWRSVVSAKTIMDDFDGPDGWTYLAGYYTKNFVNNEEKLQPLHRLLRIATMLVGAIFVSWIVLIWLVAS